MSKRKFFFTLLTQLPPMPSKRLHYSAGRLSPRVRKLLLLSIFLGPCIVMIVLFWFGPVFLTVFLSFTDISIRRPEWHWVGLENYFNIGKHPFTMKVVVNTAIYVSCTLLWNVFVGLLFALLTYYMDEKSALFYRALWLLPRSSPPVVYGLLWLWVLDPTEYGLLNQFVLALGLSDKPINWLMEYPMLFIILINGFVGCSFGMIVFSSALKSIPRDYIIAARVDGASEWRIIKDIILPLLKWPLMFVTAWQTLSLLASYEYILIVTNGGPFYATEVWSLFAYHQAFEHLELGFGAALAMVLVIVSIICVVAYMKVFKFRRMISPAKIEIT